ncbi:hypothetical protein [Gordonia sp. (in: high G+C Gram-positive bacteria)]|uniref:hypothetical protein n=1 Tax=Gordonia sp. (in: high G+C Gram-positive bacteria) TaxID=84139 RepID=UPI003C741410
MTSPDPVRWPLAPGNAPAETEALLDAVASRWPEPTSADRELITGILTRPDRRRAVA